MGKMIFFAATILLAILGLIFLVISMVIGRKIEQKQVNCTQRTVAKVITMNRVTSRDSYSTPTISWYPVYEYYIGEQRIEKQSNFGQDKQIFYDGQQVELYYNPADWNEYYVPEENVEKMRWIMGVVGGILLACAVASISLYMFIFQGVWM